mgnify:CR=1 FL=1
MKCKKTGFILLLCFLAGFFLTGSQGSISRAQITSDSIKEKENQIDAAEDEKKKLQQGLTDIKKMKEELEKSKDNLESYIVQLDANLNTVSEKIAELQSTIEQKEADIEAAAQELEAALETEQGQYEAMKVRIQFMYERGDNFYLEAILGADSFGEILNRADYFEELAAYDRRKLEEYMLNRQMIELCKEQLEQEREILKEAKAVQEAEQDNLEELINAKERQITAFESDINNKEAAIKQYEEDIETQTALISQLEAAVAEEKRRLLEESGEVITYDGGMFQWPAPSYTRISSEYGNRPHPTLGVVLFHNGLDMAAPGGSKILAAYDGKVVAADYSATMGNYIMIDHGDSLYTVYMHASALYVSKGDLVIKGEHIAAVGTTGRSTGNHLHFSVRLNGSYVNPWNYFAQ